MNFYFCTNVFGNGVSIDRYKHKLYSMYSYSIYNSIEHKNLTLRMYEVKSIKVKVNLFYAVFQILVYGSVELNAHCFS